MPMRWVNLVKDEALHDDSGVDPAQLGQVFDAVRSELRVPADFPPEVIAEAQAMAGAALLPERDETSLPFLTIDPPGSKDLDQAMHIERSGKGYRVRYAIADVPAFVKPGGAIDVEAFKRGQTIYAPDRRTPLHPEQLSEDAASLLPDQVRPAFVWDIQVDADGEGTSADVYRAMVSSKHRLDYAEVQAAVDGGTADECLVLLKEVGQRRITLEQARSGASLPMPEQEVSLDKDGHYVLAFRPPVAAEEWNAQISLMTGMAAASYAHVTAPLRRLVDRFGLVVCESICSGAPVPDWVHGALPTLPPIMSTSDHLANAVERACTDAVEAAALQHRVGETFRAMVVDITKTGALVQIGEPAILALAEGGASAGADVTVKLIEADVAKRSVRFQIVGGA